MPPKISIILPTYNERENIGKLINKILAVFQKNSLFGCIIIVDDNSPDGTGQVAEAVRLANLEKIFVIGRPKKLGLGSAYVEGFKKALALDSDYIFEMDADLSHDPNDIPRFLKEAENYDLVLGSRYVKGGQIKNWNIFRKLISRGGTFYARLILGIPIYDLTSGFKCFRRVVLKKLDFSDIQSDGYAFQVELTYKAYKAGFKIKEIPITFKERKKGASKFSQNIFWEAVFAVWKLRFGKMNK